MLRACTAILFVFAVSFTFFAIQSGDVLMYLTLVRDHLSHWDWPATDPYLYSLANAELHIAHEYLSYFLFYGAWWLLGYPGLTILKMLIFAGLFALVLRAEKRTQHMSPLWIIMWILAVFAGSFRFIERSSIISDLFMIVLVYGLVSETRITRSLVIRLSLLFLLWVQLHAGFPLGLVMLGIWGAWHAVFTPGFQKRRLPWLLLPVALLVLNPIGLDGALYPFRFALNEAQVLKFHNFEWFPTYHKTFRFVPESLAYWALCLSALLILWRQSAWFTLRGILTLFSIACGVQAIRFVPWSSFAVILCLKPWATTRIKWRFLVPTLMTLMLGVAVKNVFWGYSGSSGPRFPQLRLDYNFFPTKTTEFFRNRPIPGRLYNAHDFGSYLLWMNIKPIYHHGFVTDMNFYESDVAGLFKDQASFLALVKKYNWTMLMVDKHGSYPYFYKILSPLTDWKIVAEDDASYLIYLLPDAKN